jgi:hypothetical protein
MQSAPSNSSPGEGPIDADGAFDAIGARVQGTNINEQTLLATDYLNHFNEIAMFLEMIPDMPDMLDEAKAWQPKSYQDHARDSTFSDRDLAVEAYDHVPARYRQPFETTIGQMDNLIAISVEHLEANLASGDGDAVRMTTEASTGLLYKLIEQASSIIHGSEKTMDQAEIDVVLG